MEEKHEATLAEKETGTAIAPSAPTGPEAGTEKKKKPAAFYAVLALGGLLAISVGYDKIFGGKSAAAVNTAESSEKVVSLAPPPQLAQPASTTPAGPVKPSGPQLTRAMVFDWANNLRKAISSPAMLPNPKLDEVAENWMTTKLIGGNPQSVISTSQAKDGNRPIHVLHSGVIDNAESVLKDKIEASTSAKEFVSSSLYDGMGVYVHPLTTEKCHVVIVMQLKGSLASKIPAAPIGVPQIPGVAAVPCNKPSGACPATATVASHQKQMQMANARQSRQQATKGGFPVPLPPPAFGGKVVDVPPPPPERAAKIRDDYDPYPDQGRR